MDNYSDSVRLARLVHSGEIPGQPSDGMNWIGATSGCNAGYNLAYVYWNQLALDTCRPF